MTRKVCCADGCDHDDQVCVVDSSEDEDELRRILDGSGGGSVRSGGGSRLHLALVAGVPLLTTEGSSGGGDVAAWVAAESYLPRRITTLDARSVRRTTRQTEMSLWISFEGSAHFAAPQLDRGDHIPELVSSDESDLDEMPDLVPPGLASIQRPSARAPEE